MRRILLAALALPLLGGAAQAQLFGKGIGSAMIYGPYTGGHNYSYNTAYSYGFAFSSADTWRRDPFAYPAGIYPYRPHGRPILYRAWPKTDTPPISVPGEDGLPVLVHPGAAGAPVDAIPATVIPDGVANLRPVPQPGQGTPATLKVVVPSSAEVWVDRQKVDGGGIERSVASPPLEAGKLYVYTVRATWTENGRAVDQVRVVGIKAGETAKVNFLTAR